MKKIFLLLTLLAFAGGLNAGLYEDAAQARKEAIAEPTLDKFMVLNKMRRKYYENNNWFGMSEAEKEQMKEKKYPAGLFIMRKDPDKGLNVLFEEAGALDASAELFLNILYKKGYSGLEPGDGRILKFWEKMDADGVPRASLNLGIYYTEGIGVKRDYVKARAYLNKSLKDAVLSEAYYYIAYTYLFQKDRDKAIEIWKKGLQHKNADCGYELGVCSMEDKKYGEAVKYFKDVLAIEPDHANAMTNLGQLYMEGWGVKKNIKKGFEYYKAGADGGNPASQYMMFKCYVDAIGCEKDTDKAFSYLIKSAKQGFKPAVEVINEFKAREKQ